MWPEFLCPHQHLPSPRTTWCLSSPSDCRALPQSLLKDAGGSGYSYAEKMKPRPMELLMLHFLPLPASSSMLPCLSHRRGWEKFWVILFVLCSFYVAAAGKDDTRTGRGGYRGNANGPSRGIQPPSDPQNGNRVWKVHYG